MIYVIDDEFMVQEVLSSFIRHLGYQTKTFESGDHFLAYMDKEDFQVPEMIFSDIRMPGISGLEMVQAFKTRYPDIPCSMVTAFDDTLAHDHPVYAKLHSIIAKPFKLHHIQDALKALKQTDQASFSATPYSSASI